ncbi:hypothetical protein ANN_15847 [Periplaneta americana]|uniref:Uncharacterized protein n=1 Tax=Periplaneta americana TaxID=6978 RepID=A0ABQ8SHS5_PERAM|nr:hypothetical protein ANN_15847 [Periplaneta americana]
MGKVLSVMQRKANRFNVENRAHKVISMEKPKPAPRYPSTEQELETLKADYPQFLEQQYKKDSKLDDRLKQVFVRSQDPAVSNIYLAHLFYYVRMTLCSLVDEHLTHGKYGMDFAIRDDMPLLKAGTGSMFILHSTVLCSFQIVEESPIDSSRPLPQDRSAVEEPVYGYREPRMVPQGRFTLKQAIKFISDHQENPSTWTAAAIAKQYNINQDKLEKILFYYRTFQVHIPEKVGKKIPKKIEVEASETQSTQKLIQPQEEKLQHQENKGI